MKLLLAAISPLLTLACLGAQTQTSRFPTGAFATGQDNLPLASSPTRYQQWFSSSELAIAIARPVRIRSLAFIAQRVLQQGSNVDIEIKMAHMTPGLLPVPRFDSNLMSNVITVVPRAVHNLVANPPPGTRAVTFPFAQEFVWDGVSSVVIDLKVFGNGNNNQSYIYECLTAVSALSKTMRLFAPGNPSTLQNATLSQNGIGLVTEFDYIDGVTVSYGAGCPGTGNVTPVAGTSGGLPVPPNPAWAQTISGGAPSVPAVWIAGGSRTMWGTVPLPVELTVLNAFACFLHTDVITMIPSNTTAAGVGILSVPIPGVTLRGKKFYSQWFLLDLGAPNGVLSGTQALWHIFG